MYREMIVANSPSWPLTLYYAGDCPLCAREINLLKQKADPAKLLFIDINNAQFDAKALGLSQQSMEDLLHARFADGQWVKGVDATYWSWCAAGLGRWVAILRWKAMRPLIEFGYRLFCLMRPHLAWLPHPDGAKRCDLANADNRKPRCKD
ncbi:DUF393 domain-containing protein [Pseudomonas sp.]|uniref:thiol-disulfide oxidoreductase DCC family protein n=1 Tax=Pseudomonas sp. TaxID=306 RepID=UPI00257B2DC6|nr:DUF393 domain-containing protein [Pseudomonas sp.]